MQTRQTPTSLRINHRSDILNYLTNSLRTSSNLAIDVSPRLRPHPVDSGETVRSRAAVANHSIQRFGMEI